tara:strand:+ start:902 stop:1552 length:651 start_codon:yes stop_codon:yes gene_type:complete
MIEFKQVTATYTKDIGVFDISFKVDKGEMVFLMGPTGAGKSTILKTIYRDVLIDSGNIILDGKDISNSSNYQIPLIRQKIGMIFQDFKLINNRTVFENISLPLRIIGSSKSYIYERSQSVLKQVGLIGKENNFPFELSGGEQQRVSIARALINKPKIILADEPTGNLDPNVSDEILDLLNMFTEKGTSVLMSTHNFPLIKTRNKRFIEVGNGRIID